MPGLALPYLLPEIKNPDLQFKKYLNFLLSLMFRRSGELVVLSKPFDISINPSTSCQLHCPHCQTGNGKMDRPAALLPLELHKHMIAPLLDELFIIRYFGTGESLLNRQFTELLRQTAGKEIFTFITSNLSLKFTDEQIDDLVRSGLNVLGVSLDGAEPETYNRYRVGGNYQLVIDNMRRIIASRKKFGSTYPLIQWRFLVFKHNMHEIPRVRELAKEFGVDLLEFAQGHAPDDGGPIEKIDLCKVEAAKPTNWGPALATAIKNKNTLLQRLVKQGTFENRIPPNEVKFKKCDWHYTGSYWYPDGGVGPCCHPTHLDQDFGRITLTNRFEDVWNGERYREARSLMRQRKKTDNFCAHCPGKSIMDRFFVTSIKGILLNAPLWVLKVLNAEPDRFFSPIDNYLIHAEVQSIMDNRQSFLGDYSEIRERLRKAAGSNEQSRSAINLIADLLGPADGPAKAQVVTSDTAILACPVCSGGLTGEETKAPRASPGNILERGIEKAKAFISSDNRQVICSQCSARFPIQDGVPNLITDPGLKTSLEELDYDSVHGINAAGRKETFKTWEEVFNGLSIRKGRILEIGSGTGNLTWGLMHSSGFDEVYATDISSKYLKYIRREFGSNAKNKTFYYLCDANALPFRENSFDAVAGHSVLHHFLNYEKTLESVFRILKNNGSAVFFEPVLQGKLYISFLIDLIRRIDEQQGLNILSDEDRNKIVKQVRHHTKEFYIKGDKERLKALEDKYIFDTNKLKRLATEIGFSDFFVKPYKTLDISYKSYVAFQWSLLKINNEKLERFSGVFKAFEETIGLMLGDYISTPMCFLIFKK